MRLYRCRICRNSYLAASRPEPCAFCGARRKLVVTLDDFQSTPVGELTPGSQDCLRQLLDRGVEDCAFYRAAANVADTDEGRALFQVLARIVSEQARVIARTLLPDGEPPEELYETGASSPSHRENLEEAAHRARQTLDICREGLADAEEERVRQILEAFAETRQDHLKLLNA